MSNSSPRRLRISFDLDDTLIVYGDRRTTDPCAIPVVLKYFLRDPLREGTRELMNRLSKKDVEIWIYTTSYRSERAIRMWWRWNRLPRLGGVINQRRHTEAMRRRRTAPPPTKLPLEWNIDLHVDDSEGVRLEQPASSRVEILVIHPLDRGWTRRVLERVDDHLSRRTS